MRFYRGQQVIFRLYSPDTRIGFSKWYLDLCDAGAKGEVVQVGIDHLRVRILKTGETYRMTKKAVVPTNRTSNI